MSEFIIAKLSGWTIVFCGNS